MPSSTIPIFPLHNVVLFPGIFLPLYIFEPRYREMVAHALEGNQLIGIVLLQSGKKVTRDVHQPIYPIGCVGRITHTDRLADGCYNIILHGLEKFRLSRKNRPHIPTESLVQNHCPNKTTETTTQY